MPITERRLAPEDAPSADDWADALKKGLGRAVLWAKAGRGPDRALLLNACLTDHRYDGQCEEPRGRWLWDVIAAAGAVDDLRGDLLAAMRRIRRQPAARQLCQLCVPYARHGDPRFHDALRAVVTGKPVEDDHALGEEELITLEGVGGFLLAAEARGAGLLRRGWEWDDGSLMFDADERFGRRAAALLECGAALSPELRRFRDAWRASVQGRIEPSKESRDAWLEGFTLEVAIRAAEEGSAEAGRLRGWGMRAGVADLRVVLERLLTADRPDVIARYLRVFSNRPLPAFDTRLLDLFDHNDEEVRRRAFTAVSRKADPAIRRLALERLPDWRAEPSVVKLFLKNFHPCDEALLCRNLALPEDEDGRHGLLMDLRNVLEDNPDARCDDLALWGYRWTPCVLCRQGFATLLFTRCTPPAWFVEEARHDADPYVREMARHAAGGPGATPG